jgi:hypothetical protein
MVSDRNMKLYRSMTTIDTTTILRTENQYDTLLFSSKRDQEEQIMKTNNNEEKLKQLGFDAVPSPVTDDKQMIPVKVTLLPEVDAVTLTAVGFGLIAFNFFVLANLGDGGVSGIVATVINLSRQ